MYNVVNFCSENVASDWNITNCIGHKRLCGDRGVLAKQAFFFFKLILSLIKVFQNDGSAGGRIMSRSQYQTSPGTGE